MKCDRGYEKTKTEGLAQEPVYGSTIVYLYLNDIITLRALLFYKAEESDRMTNPGPSDISPGGINQSSGIAKRIRVDEALFLTLIALSTVGIGITNFWPIESFWFWAAMVPVFGLTSIYIGWSKARRRGEGVTRIIRIQVLHWIGLLAALFLIYYLLSPTGRIDYNQLALITLLALALTTFLAGVHFDWRFMVVGIILGAAVAGAAFLEQFIWIIIIPIVAAIGLVVFWWQRKV